MKVLFTTVSLHPEHGGGIAERTRQLALHLAALGHQCSVAAIEGGAFATELAARGIPVYASGFARIRYHIPFLDPWKLGRLVKEADVIHVLGLWNLLSVSTCLLASRYGTPYGLSAAGEFEGFGSARLDKKVFRAAFANRMIAGAASLIALTPLEQSQIIEKLGTDRQKLVVVPNGVDPRPMDRQIKKGRTDSPYVLFLGRLTAIKGPDLLLEAFATTRPDFPEFKLVFAGSDLGMRAALEARAREMGVGDAVTFAGFLDEAAKSAALAGASLLAVPSRDEAMSLVALEAGGAGLPVLITDRCGFDVETLGGGRVVPATVAGLAEGLRAMILMGTGLAAMGERLRAHVVANYGWPTVAQKLASHLSSLSRPTPHE